MGKTDSNSNPQSQPKHKSKSRMSYLKRRRQISKPTAEGVEAKQDEHGQLYGDYAPAYGPKQQHRHGRYGKHGGGRKIRELLKPGMKGFLCTTNFKEWECVRDAYNILNEYSEDKDKPEPSQEEGKTAKDAEAEASEATQKEEKTTSDSGTVDKKDESSELKKTGDVEPPAEASTDKAPSVPEKDKEADSASSGENGSETEKKAESNEDDIDLALTNELKELKSDKTAYKFNRVNTGIDNVVFISTTIDNPTELVYKIFADVAAKKQTKSRSIHRFLPIEVTCNSNNMDEVKARVKELLGDRLNGYVSYKLEVNVRYNNALCKDDIILTLAEMISKTHPLSFVDLNNPQYTILIEVLKTTMCLGIVKDFAQNKKFNLMEVGAVAVPSHQQYSNWRRHRRGPKDKNNQAKDKDTSQEKETGSDTKDSKERKYTEGSTEGNGSNVEGSQGNEEAATQKKEEGEGENAGETEGTTTKADGSGDAPPAEKETTTAAPESMET